MSQLNIIYFNEKFSLHEALASPPVFPSIILLKVDTYEVTACIVNQCSSCTKSSVVRWQVCYGSLAVSSGFLMGDILLCLQYVIIFSKESHIASFIGIT